MKKQYSAVLAPIAALCIVFALPLNLGHAQTINTTAAWNGSSEMFSWGSGANTPTFGQTITPTASQTSLSSFTFYLENQVGPQANFQAYVYQWNNASSAITGPALFTSAIMTAPGGSSFVPVTISTGNARLVQGQQYVLFFTTLNVSQSGTPAYGFGGLTTSAYPGGKSFFNNTVSFAGLSTSSSWFDGTHCCGGIPELAFIATFNTSFASLLPPGASTNVVNVASGIDNFTNGGSALPSSFSNLFNLSGTQQQTALMQLDGEASTDAEKGAFALMNQFLGLMLDPFVDGRFGASGGPIGFAPDQETSFPPDIALAYASVLKAPAAQSFDRRWTTWGSGFGASSTTNGNAAIGSNNVTAADYGFAGGMDYHVTRNTLYGFALAGSGTNWNLAQGLGSGHSDAFQAGVYGKSYWGLAYVAAALASTNNWFSTNRSALGDDITARFAGQSYGGRLEAGYRYAAPVAGATAGATPYAAIQTQWFHTPAYSETDLTGGGLGLTYNAMTANDTRSELGARFDDPTLLNGMPLILRAKLSWAHDWVSNPALDAVFQSLPGSSFVVNGAAPPKNSALTSAGAQYILSPAWSFTAKFDGEFASSSQTYGGTGTLRYTW